MSGGTPVHRQWVLVLHDGEIVVDWGDGQVQSVFSGEFVQASLAENGVSIRDDELKQLMRSNRVDHYDATQVWFTHLPERPARSID